MRKQMMVSILACLTPASLAANELCPDGSGPRSAVMDYLGAMHKHQFDKAYDHVTESMTDGRSREDWAALQARAYQPGKVDIYGVDVRAARGHDNDAGCSARAVVPNILSSRDKLNEHGLVEFETYTVVKSEGGVWRVDAQETLFEDDAVSTWFPEVQFFRPED